MPIHKPGQRFRYHRILGRRGKKRDVVALLSLTAMVDMFTVLVVFLLQNYDTKNFIVYTPDNIVLPKAESIKDLKPAFVISISNKEILLETEVVATYQDVAAQSEWLIPALQEKLKEGLKLSKEKYEESLQNKIKQVVDAARGEDDANLVNWDKVTIQADKNIDFLTVKKVMYTVTEAGAGEVNFAVIKENKAETKSQNE